MSEANIPRSAEGFFERVRLRGNPVAHPAAVITSGPARFTVLTSRLLRLEWTPATDGATEAEVGFENRGSFAFPTRYTDDLPRFTSRSENGWLLIETDYLKLRYRENSGAFRLDNLTISFELNGQIIQWQPGLLNRGNLRGTRRTLDECVGDVALEEGLLSRDGWALFDDSSQVLFNSQTGWVEPRPNQDLQDWYFFGYGHAYTTALQEYTRFGGEIPLIPRFVLGGWWSRYWAYSDQDLKQIVNDFAHYDLPLDVLVLDMDWHTEDTWTGYSWNRKLFPDPPAFLQWVHQHGLRTTLNLHPAQGVQPFEDVYQDFNKAMNLDATEGESIPFHITDKNYVQHYFELLHHPLEDNGVDFWWMDWQQGQTSEMAGLDPLPWLNHLHFLDSTRRGLRAMLYSRWGGLGNHRYHIGFSGDTHSVWEALQFQPYFTATASNVCYGWWSHDIGGHQDPVEPELFARWVQFGALSPCLRLHATKLALAERRPWTFPAAVFQAARQAFHLRYQLVPYFYTLAREAMDSSLSLSRPMYYASPEEEAAYVARYQYYLGDQIIAAPIVFPADPVTGLAVADVWLPEGEWIDYATKESFSGPRWVHLSGDIDRLPMLVKAGSIIPLAPLAMSTDHLPKDRLILRVFPGSQGNFRFYEDDGTTEAYHWRDEYQWTNLAMHSPDAESCELEIAPVEGNCPSLPEARSYEIYFEGTHRPVSVTVNGQPVTEWRYDADTLTTVVSLPPQPKDKALTVHLAVASGNKLVALGEAHNQQVQLAEVRQLLGARTPAAAWENLPEAILKLAAPGRTDAVARLGGPFARFIEYITPEEAQNQLGALIVSTPANGDSYDLAVIWRLYHDGKVEEFRDGGPNQTSSQVLYSPFKVTQTETTMYWEAEVVITWRGHQISFQHRSKTLFPTISAWHSLVYNEQQHQLTPTDLFDPSNPSQPRTDLRWRPHLEDLKTVKSLADPFYMRLREWYQARIFAGEKLAGYAVAQVNSPDEREVILHFRSPGPFQLWLNGAEVEIVGSVSGTPREGAAFPPIFQVSTSTVVRLQAGRNSLVAATKSPDGRPHWWLNVALLRPDGSPMTDLISERDWPASSGEDNELIGL